MRRKKNALVFAQFLHFHLLSYSAFQKKNVPQTLQVHMNGTNDITKHAKTKHQKRTTRSKKKRNQQENTYYTNDKPSKRIKKNMKTLESLLQFGICAEYTRAKQKHVNSRKKVYAKKNIKNSKHFHFCFFPFVIAAKYIFHKKHPKQNCFFLPSNNFFFDFFFLFPK